MPLMPKNTLRTLAALSLASLFAAAGCAGEVETTGANEGAGEAAVDEQSAALGKNAAADEPGAAVDEQSAAFGKNAVADEPGAAAADQSAADDEQGAAPCENARCTPTLPTPIVLKPNLVAVEVTPGAGYCVGSNGSVQIRIRNAGLRTAGPSHTRVDFGNVRYHRSTPSLAPGATFDTTVGIPAGCYQPDCFFTIVADEYNVVNESSESDNDKLGICVG